MPAMSRAGSNWLRIISSQAGDSRLSVRVDFSRWQSDTLPSVSTITRKRNIPCSPRESAARGYLSVILRTTASSLSHTGLTYDWCWSGSRPHSANRLLVQLFNASIGAARLPVSIEIMRPPLRRTMRSIVPASARLIPAIPAEPAGGSGYILSLGMIIELPTPSISPRPKRSFFSNSSSRSIPR